MPSGIIMNIIIIIIIIYTYYICTLILTMSDRIVTRYMHACTLSWNLALDTNHSINNIFVHVLQVKIEFLRHL